MKLLLLFVLSISSLHSVQAQWQAHTMDSLEITSLDASGSTIFAGTLQTQGIRTNTGIIHSTDNGTTWAYSHISPYKFPVLSVVPNGATLYAATNNGLRMTTDGGNEWVTINKLINFSVYSTLVRGNDVFTASYLGVHISTDNGNDWRSISTGLPDLTYAKKIVASGTALFTVVDSVLTYIVPDSIVSFIYRSTNNGESWSLANTGLANKRILSLATQGNYLFAGTRNGVYVSTTAGEQWVAANTGLPNARIYSIAISGSNVFAAGDSGVYHSTNNGASWVSISQGLPNTNVRHLAVNGTHLFAALSQKVPAGQLWSRALSLLSNVEEESQHRNVTIYPNPTSGRCRIEGTVATIRDMHIYNIHGEKIISSATMDEQARGEIDLSGYPKGIYVIQFYDGNNLQLRKVVVL